MFEQLKAPQNVLAFRLSGTVTGEDIDQYRAQMHQSLDQDRRIGICMDLTGLSDLERDGLTKGVKADLDFLAHLKQIDRLAFVSDKEWPQIVIDMADNLLPGTKAKSFTSSELDQAVAWAAEVDSQAKPSSGPGIRTFPTTENDVLGFEMYGPVGGEQLKPVMDELNDFLERHERVRLLNRVKHIAFDPSIFFQSGMMSVKLAAMQKVEKYAIVGAPNWIEKAVAGVDSLFPDMQMRTFAADNEAEAWDWIGAKPK